MEFAFAPGTAVPDLQKGAGEGGCVGAPRSPEPVFGPVFGRMKTSREEGI